MIEASHLLFAVEHVWRNGLNFIRAGGCGFAVYVLTSVIRSSSHCPSAYCVLNLDHT